MSKQLDPIDLKEKFYIFDNFLTSNKHTLEKGSAEWTSDKIFFQLSIEHADKSPLTHKAQKFEKDGKVGWNSLINSNRDKNIFYNPIIIKDESFDNIDIDIVKTYDDENIIIASSGILQVVDPRNLEVVDFFLLDSKELSIQKMEVRDSYIIILDYGLNLSVINRSNKKIQSLSNVWNFYIIDNSENIAVTNEHCDLAVFILEDLEIIENHEGHEDTIKGVFATSDSFITWTAQEPEEDEDFEWDVEDEDDLRKQYDISIRIWDRNSEDVDILTKHKNFIKKVKKISDDLLVSFDNDDLLIVWNLKSKKVHYKLTKFTNIQNIYSYENVLIVIELTGLVSFRNIEDGKKIKSIQFKDRFTDSDKELVYFISNNRMIIGSDRGNSYIINLETLEEEHNLNYSCATIEYIKELKNGNISISDSHGNVVTYDSTTYEPINIVDTQIITNEFIETEYGLLLNEDGFGLALVNSDIENFKSYNLNKMMSSLWSNEVFENLLVTISIDGEVFIYDLNTQEIVVKKKLYSDMGTIKKIDNSHFISFGGNRVDLWHKEKRLNSAEYNDDENAIADVIISDETIIVIPDSFNDDVNIQVYDRDLNFIMNLEVDEENNGYVSCACIYTKELLLVGFQYGAIELWDIQKGKLKKSIELKSEIEIADIKVVDKQIFAIDDKSKIHIFNDTLKKTTNINLSKVSMGYDIDIVSYKEAYLITASIGAHLYNKDFDKISILKNYEFVNSINNKYLFKKDGIHYVFDSYLNEINNFEIENIFKENPEILVEFELCFKVNSIYIYHNMEQKYIILSNNSKYFYDGIVSVNFIYKNHLIVELNGNIKYIKIQ